jgi:N-sulfoglucosamine sulfohydrolase
MGCYGDKYATPPNMDRLAAKGVIYTLCWSNTPVCARPGLPSFTACTTGSEHMRSLLPYPTSALFVESILGRIEAGSDLGQASLC